MKVPSYLFKSNGRIPVYYFRIRVPKELQPILGRLELKKSLRTNDKSTAILLCRQYVTAAEKHFAGLRLKLFQTSLNGTYDSGDQESLFNSLVRVPDQAEFDEIAMSRLIDLYIKEETSKRGHDIASGIEKNLLRFMEIVGDQPIRQYTVEDSQKYRDVLLKIPKRINGPRYKDQSIKAILKREYPPEQRLSITTVNHRLNDTATFLNWAVKNDLIKSHPFKNAVLKKKSSLDQERSSLTDAEIRTLLENLTADRQSLSWCILITCYTGLRQSEVAGLDGNDIIKLSDGTWCIDINDRGDKKLKNNNARRIIPLHPVLMDTGLIEFAQSRSGVKLFSDIKPYKGKYGHQVSKDFAKYRRSLGINGAGQTFHGIRHSVISKLWSAGIPEAHTAAIAGHQRGERESYIRYAKKNDMRPLLAAINAIDYGDMKILAWLAGK